MKKKKIYAIVLVMANINGISTEPVGMYSSLKEALDWKKQLDATTFANNTGSNCVFDIIEFNLNEKPLLLETFKHLKEKVLEKIDESLSELMKNGYIDQLVGEDGNFYYTVTDVGKKYLEKNKIFNKPL